MTDNVQRTQIDLSWVALTGGPDVQMDEDGHYISGLPGWFSLNYSGCPEERSVKLHTEWVEPVSGHAGTLIAKLAPNSNEAGGVVWEACFMFHDAKEAVHIPVRGRGVATAFNEAQKAALAWRPYVHLSIGIENWTNPAGGEGVARGLMGGDLTWRTDTEGRISWSYRSHAAVDLQGFGYLSGSIHGDSDTHDQMFFELDEARERVRSGLRNFLLNF